MANRFWVGGTGTWDASGTTHWAATSGGAGGQSVPGSSDTVTIDANSGAGTITVNTNFTIQTLTTGAMGMTLDFGTNNNSPTFNTGGWSNAGAGTRTINLGSGTFNFTGGGAAWGTTTSLTLGANTATFAFSGNTALARSADFGGAALSNPPSVSIAANSSRGSFLFSGPAMTVPTLSIAAPNAVSFGSSLFTLTNLVLSGGSVSSPIQLTSNVMDTVRTIPLTNSTSGAGLMVRALNTSTGTITGTDSINLGLVGGNISLTAPSGGSGGGQRVFGG